MNLLIKKKYIIEFISEQNDDGFNNGNNRKKRTLSTIMVHKPGGGTRNYANSFPQKHDNSQIIKKNEAVERHDHLRHFEDTYISVDV